MMPCSEDGSTHRLTQDAPSLLQDCLVPGPLQHNVPREPNCLCKAKRDRRRPLSSFMVLSMWLALRELPTRTTWRDMSTRRDEAAARSSRAHVG